MDINGRTEQVEDKPEHDAFVAFMATPEGPLRTAEYDKMICGALLDAFGKRTTNSTLKLFEAIGVQVNGIDHMFDDVITYVGEVARCAHGKYSEYPASTLVPRPDY